MSISNKPSALRDSFWSKIKGGWASPRPPGSATDQFFVFQVYNKATYSYTERKEFQKLSSI